MDSESAERRAARLGRPSGPAPHAKALEQRAGVVRAQNFSLLHFTSLRAHLDHHLAAGEAREGERDAAAVERAHAVAARVVARRVARHQLFCASRFGNRRPDAVGSTNNDARRRQGHLAVDRSRVSDDRWDGEHFDHDCDSDRVVACRSGGH